MTVTPIEGEPFRFHVQSDSEDIHYLVDLEEHDGNGWCGCAQFQFRCTPALASGHKSRCKHILAAMEHQKKKEP
mgnify:CR=1 FL=1